MVLAATFYLLPNMEKFATEGKEKMKKSEKLISRGVAENTEKAKTKKKAWFKPEKFVLDSVFSATPRERRILGGDFCPVFFL
jgi:hypothetical protein